MLCMVMFCMVWFVVLVVCVFRWWVCSVIGVLLVVVSRFISGGSNLVMMMVKMLGGKLVWWVRCVRFLWLMVCLSWLVMIGCLLLWY